MVLGPDLTILYANELVWTRSITRQSKCYEAFSDRSSPCEACPAEQVFQPGLGVPPVGSTNDAVDTLCGIQQIFALKTGDGKAECALALLKMDRAAPMMMEAGLKGHASGGHPAWEPQLIGQSAVMQQLFQMIHMVADTRATVLLQGESGTGKELVAKTIHRLSPRRYRPFIVVDCGSLAETLLESELFGHVKGAFTGAVTSKKGLFEEADGGTLFLDEIADTSRHFQAKLLRVLQEGEIKPVGSARSVKVDVRIISATNKDLLGLIKKRAFREDLYYRLAVLPLMIPALRDRCDDVPLLAEHFVELSCQRHRRPLRTIGTGAMLALMHAPWLGNVRQLQHTIERAVLTGTGPVLTEQDLLGPPSEPVRKMDLASVTKHAVQTAECASIHEALRLANGSKVRAARLLNISRASLYAKLRAYGFPHELG
jgi:two-component system response regulator AtoC